jgi:GT2 family glycosyltransferase
VRPRVAVIVVSFNDAGTVAQTIGSLGRQTALPEISGVILADDASRDGTVDRAAEAWQHEVPFSVSANSTNIGQWPNLNRALREAAALADWALILHADDYVESVWAEALMERIERCADDIASICTSWNVLTDNGAIEPGESGEGVVRVDGGTEAVVDTMMRGCWWKISGAALRLRAFADVGDFDARYPQSGDWEWLLRALQKGWAFEYLPRSLVNYRLHAASMSSRAMREDLEITEALSVLDRYAMLLPRETRARFLMMRMRFLARRTARAVMRADLPRVRVAARTGVRIASSARRHLL